MEFKDIWNDLCFRINQNNQNIPERDFQIIAESLFEKLGWSSYRHEIITQKAIPVGASGITKPDIIISDNEKKLFVVELKKPSISISGRNSEQLFSYMRLLKLKFGLLLGETLQAYYEVSDDYESPIKIVELHFISDSEDGINFIKLLSKDEYSQDNIDNYCKQKIELNAENEKSQQFINELCTENGKKIIIDLLKEKLSTKYTEEVIVSIINSIQINISRTTIDKTNIVEENDEVKTNEGKDYTQYFLNGHFVGGKGALVKEVVRLYIEKNPNITFNELKKKFPDQINGTKFGIVNTSDNAKKINKTEAAPRYNSEPLKLSNNDEIAICNQWHTKNIVKFIQKAKELGFNIVENKGR